ncbi:hypothetical protein [Absidia glauca]|uniref:Uncharacterized protein n=1 Tax=Absidia glauca TaxID=4829 RepID=A0A163J0J1_ABSGL|nr:hypothetical protein [Absidia glauca]
MATDEQQKQILTMMGIHYCRHELIPIGAIYFSNDQIRYKNAREMYDYCVSNNLRDVWVYMYRNWYTRVQYNRWARSAVSGKVPMGKTTMMIEAHWKVLKKCHLYHYNRARLDLLVYAILQQYYRKLTMKYQAAVVFRQETTTFEKRFHEEWRKGIRAQISGTDYMTSLDLWLSI